MKIKIHPSFIDLLASALLFFLFVTGVTIQNKPAKDIHKTPDILLPKAEIKSPISGIGGLEGRAVVSVKANKDKVEYFIEDRPMDSLDAVYQELKKLAPGSIIIKAEKDLPVSVVVKLLVKAGDLGIPASLAYDPEDLKEGGS